jgi:signal transduction histidine kinase
MTWRHTTCQIVVVFLAAWVGTAQSQALLLSHALATITTAQGTSVSPVTLPYTWDRQHPGLGGVGTFDIQFGAPAPVNGLTALYVPRLGNTYEIWLNDVLLQRKGDVTKPDSGDFSKAPRYLEFTPSLLKPQNVLRIVVRADAGRNGGLAPVSVGPESAVEPAYRTQFIERTVGALAIMILSIVVGTLSLALWMTQKDVAGGRARRDSLYLLAGTAELAWALRMSDLLIEQPFLPWPQWAILRTVVGAVWYGGMVLFSFRIAGWHRNRAMRNATPVVWCVMGSGILCTALGSYLHSGTPMTIWYSVASLIMLPTALTFAWAASRRGASATHKVVALALFVNVLAGLRDIVVLLLRDTYAEQTWIRYTSALFGVALAFVVVQRFRDSNTALRDLLTTLESRVTQKEAELRESYSRVEKLARVQERIAERTSVLRDMHDGVGSHITSAIRQLQSEKGVVSEVVRTLRDSLDQLKLSIDAMSIPAGDVTALLASLRYRLAPRFLASDLALHWDVDEIRPVAGMDTGGMRQLQFMLLESFSNVLQHARAHVLEIQAHAHQHGARLRIIDDGIGFDRTALSRNGLRSMQDRANAIGAKLTVDSRPGRTIVEIILQ